MEDIHETISVQIEHSEGQEVCRMTPTLMIDVEGWTAVVSSDVECIRRARLLGVREGHEFCLEHPKFEEVCSIRAEVSTKHLDALLSSSRKMSGV